MHGHDSEYCEPCGECSWCQGNKRARAQEKVLRQALKRALVQVRHLAWNTKDELTACGPEEVAQHPTLRAHERRMETAYRVLRRLEPLTHKRRR